MERQYRRFCSAVRKHDAAAVEALIRDFPELHHYEGDAGGLVQILDDEAPDLLEVAFAAGLHPDAGQANTPQTVLQKAACTGDLEKLRLLLRYGADPEKRNDWGETALGYACSWGELEAVKVLVEAGANVNAVEANPETGSRRTALDCAKEYPEIATYLRGRGAKLLLEVGT